MRKHFVTFYSHGTVFHETTTREIDSWDVEKAAEMARTIIERHGARPFAFKFTTRAREDDELDSKVVERSVVYFLEGTIRTLADLERENRPEDEILRMNMRFNGIDRVVENKNSWRTVHEFHEGDVVLDWKL